MHLVKAPETKKSSTALRAEKNGTECRATLFTAREALYGVQSDLLD